MALKRPDELTTHERFVYDEIACRRWLYVLVQARNDPKITWRISIEDLKLYQLYLDWATYRRRRSECARDPAMKDVEVLPPDEPDPAARPGRDAGGPRYYHAYWEDPERFVTKRRRGEVCVPLYTEATPMTEEEFSSAQIIKDIARKMGEENGKI